MNQPRRQLLAAATLGPALLQGCARSEVQGMSGWAEARRAVEALRSGWRTRSGWNLPQTLHHLAQSIEYSMVGFPAPKSPLFQATAGRLAFAFFDSRGRMSHGLTEPIPGAPALPPDQALAPAIDRLLQAMARFDAHAGPLQPHFAYGALDKASYVRAHLMHLADHWTELVPA